MTYCGMFLVLLLLVTGYWLLVTSSAIAATGINDTINFQGKVVNSDGTNVTDGSYDFTFTIYDDASAGTTLWTETWDAGTSQVTVTDGIFQVALGTHTDLPGSIDFNTDNIYLGVNFNADGEMTPRIRFTAVPQAFNAEALGGVESESFLRSDTSDSFTSGTLTFDDSTVLAIGTGNDLQLTHDGTNSTITSATGDLIIDNTLTTGSSIMRLGTDTSATDFQIQNNTTTALFTIDGAGTLTVSSLDCTANANGGALTADASGVISCSDDDNDGATTTLQQAYDNDTDGSDATIALTTADDSIVINNPATGGTDSTFAFLIDQNDTTGVNALQIDSEGTDSNALVITHQGDTSNINAALHVTAQSGAGAARFTTTAGTNADVPLIAIISTDDNYDQTTLHVQHQGTGNYVRFTNGVTDYFTLSSDGTVTLAATGLLDLSNIDASTTTEGLIIPQNTTCTAATAEGQVCWDTDNDALFVGDGATAIEVGTSTTLQQAYENGSTITLNTADASVDIVNPASGGTGTSYALFIDQNDTSGVNGIFIDSEGTTTSNAITIFHQGDTANTNAGLFVRAESGAGAARFDSNAGAAADAPLVEIVPGGSFDQAGLFLNIDSTSAGGTALEIDSENTSAPALVITHAGDTSNANSAIHVTAESGAGAVFAYTDFGSGADSSLLSVYSDNTAYDKPAVTIRQDGVGNILSALDETTEVFVIEDGGEVGIGTGSPDALLTVQGDTARINLKDSSGGDPAIGFQEASEASYATIIGARTGVGAGDLRFLTDDGTTHSQKMRITSSGQVLIGNGSGNHTLNVGGHIASTGRSGRAGTGDTTDGNIFNIDWTGSVANLWIDTSNQGAIQTSSDRRVKKNIANLGAKSGLDAINALNPVTFNWKQDQYNPETQYGFIAQEVRNVLPDLVINTGLKTKEAPDGQLRLDYNGLFAPIVMAIQEQQQEIEDLQTLAASSEFIAVDERVTELEDQIAGLIDPQKAFDNRLNKLESRVAGLATSEPATASTSSSTTSGSVILPSNSIFSQDLAFSGLITMENSLTVESEFIVKENATIYGELLVDTAQVADALFVHGNATFFKDLLVKGNIIAEGAIEYSSQQVGTAIIPRGGREVKIIFADVFAAAPLMQVTLASAAPDLPTHQVEQVSPTSFMITLNGLAPQDMSFTWQALPVTDPTLTTGDIIDTNNNGIPDIDEDLPEGTDPAPAANDASPSPSDSPEPTPSPSATPAPAAPSNSPSPSPSLSSTPSPTALPSPSLNPTPSPAI